MESHIDVISGAGAMPSSSKSELRVRTSSISADARPKSTLVTSTSSDSLELLIETTALPNAVRDDRNNSDVTDFDLSSGDEADESRTAPEPETHHTNGVGTTSFAAASSSSSSDPFDAHFRRHFERDPYLLAHRGTYFFGMGANAAYFPFAVQIWLKKDGAGIDTAMAGFVYAAGHISSMFAAPLLSSIADRSERARRLVLICGFVCQALAIVLMSIANTFGTVILCQALIEASGSAIWTGMDAATQRLLMVVKGNTSEYGNTRAWGAVGWGLFALLFGVFFDRFGLSYGYYLFGITTVPAVICSLYVPLEKRAASVSGRALALKAILRADVALVFAVVLVTGILLQIVDVYRFPFLASIGASNALLGGSLTVTAVSEAPFFFVTSALLQRISLKSALCIVLAGYALRFMYYAQIGIYPMEAPEYTLPAELLHGFTFALGWAAATQYVAVLLPPELSASAQGLLAAVQWGLASAIGSLGGGAIAHAFGWRTMWRSFAGLAAVTFLIFMMVGKTDVPLASQILEGDEGEEEESENNSSLGDGDGGEEENVEEEEEGLERHAAGTA